MKMPLLTLRRNGSMDDSSGPLEFEFAHLLDAVSGVQVDVMAGVGPEVVADPEPDDEVDLRSDPEPDLEADVVADPEPDVEPDVVADVAVSRFADSGLDDDRLPVAVKRRRGRRRRQR